MSFSNSIILLQSLVTSPASHTFTRKTKTYGLTRAGGSGLSMPQQQCPRNISANSWPKINEGKKLAIFTIFLTWPHRNKVKSKDRCFKYDLSLIKGQRSFYTKPILYYSYFPFYYNCPLYLLYQLLPQSATMERNAKYKVR